MISIPLPAHNIAEISGSGEANDVKKGISGLPIVIKRGALQFGSHAFSFLPHSQSFRAPAPFLPASIANPTSPPSTMAGSGAKGTWEASCVTNNDIEDLK